MQQASLRICASIGISLPSRPACQQPGWVSPCSVWLSGLGGGFASRLGHGGAMAVARIYGFGEQEQVEDHMGRY